MRRPMDILLPKGCGNEEKMSVIEKIFGTHSSRELKRIEPLVDKIEALRPTMQALSDEELRGKTEEYKKRLTEGETLDDLLPEAYATVREAAKRVLNMEHYRVQLIGGIILHQGRIAEMRTGEGKTLVSTLPAYLNALEGKGVHVVTVNDYLAKRDAEWMGQVHEFLGLKVGVVLNSMTSEERQEAYKCDITYVTNNELGFDYLRDNMVIYKEQLVLRGLHYAIIDEVDSVLIDEARTPLIISGQSGKSTALYEMCDLLARQMKRGDDVQELTKMDAIMGVVRPGDMGFDVVHLNLHKTFATPHGGGGPGSGPVACKSILQPYLPGCAIQNGQEEKLQLKAFHGNFLVVVKALTYMLTLGTEGIRSACEGAVLNANYMMAKLKDLYPVPYGKTCMHEFVLSLEELKKETGVSALDVAKSLIDHGIHPPTMYFPLIVHEALMFEPTETESRETLDEAAEVMRELYQMAHEDGAQMHDAPHHGQIRRPDEVLAARQPVLRYRCEQV